ncbi:MAG: pseudouridine synthase [Alkalinema sp. RU_4_3]|nr:pseudouridine synthase [Alkalinema sp. RU_4_3]
MPHRYILFSKPFNVLSQFSSDGSEKVTLKQFIDLPDIYPVGRLDYDSEGLMLLTSDGPLQHRLSHPKFEHPRTYWVQVENQPSDSDLLPLIQGGLKIQDYRTKPAQVKLIKAPNLADRVPPIRSRQSIPTAWLSITLTEGRNRQVRRMTAAIGFPTLRLVRTQIGHLHLEDLASGQWRDLSEAELRQLKNNPVRR